MKYIIGLDLGQAADWTALSVLERTELEVPTPRARWRYSIRHIDRVRRVAYDKIVERARMLCERLDEQPVLVVDATGVGRPVVDLLERFRIRAEVVPVTITGGTAAVRHGREWAVPKRDLASTTAVLMQTDRLLLGPTVPWAEALVRELQSFRVRISSSGHDTYEAWRESDHDDLVLSVSLAAWYGERGGVSGQAWLDRIEDRAARPEPGVPNEAGEYFDHLGNRVTKEGHLIPPQTRPMRSGVDGLDALAELHNYGGRPGDGPAMTTNQLAQLAGRAARR